MPEKYLYIANDPVLQSQAVELLCRCFDEWVDFSNKYGKCFPFHEESFAAFDEKDPQRFLRRGSFFYQIYIRILL